VLDTVGNASTTGESEPVKAGESSAAKGKQGGKGKAASGQQTPAIKVIKKNKPVEPVVLEAEIAVAEKRLEEISAQMSQPEIARDATELVKLDDAYRQTEARLATLYSQWEEAAAKG